ncbi:hypothetical protein [Limosilactobacillus reuteri]|uniref:hypothetical protein n=1 Tax=Limosilactobacillus reuteri TaxID=1598 RepID=UPI001E5A0CB1|nr:hypothetical protein [Limosilactobacillus reuteri]MCC4440103.1 hypothetical protein [Limosilactobacillus reuteri]
MNHTKRISVITVLIVIIVLLCGGCSHWYFNSTASGGRVRKDFKSEFNNGIPRDIKVYNADGKVIMEEKGKFDIKHSSRSLQYVDQNNRKHNIYFGDNSTVTVDELK